MMSLLWERKPGAQGNEKQEEIGMLISSCMCVLGGERKFPPKSHWWFRGHSAGFLLVLLHLKVKNLEGVTGGAWGKGPVVPQAARPVNSPAGNTAADFYAPPPSVNLSS